ncbi:AraC family transcriptional regulator (plasmid) [Agrobacterium tumefaciens]|jgi:AraC-like DNA-binding protein|nr:AraC family transcriptional regulator [Agrobacterium tumefaciens]QAB01113.1 AraC family transcriptional regulator [Agrobacterium tumefaciens]
MHNLEGLRLVAPVFDFQPGEVRRSAHKELVHEWIDWGRVRADLVRRTGFKRQETKLVLNHHAFLFNLRGEATAGEDFIQGRSVGFRPRRPGSVIFVPARHEWTGWDEGDETGAYLLLTIDPSFAQKAMLPEHLAALKPSIGFRNTMIEASLQKVAAELRNPDQISVVMAESQAVQSLAHFVRLNEGDDEILTGGFSLGELQTLFSIIEDPLRPPPTLDELADAIGISRRHFFRVFKQSTGKTPHRYLAEHRLKRAVDLLRDTDLLATEIAIECGFSSSSHFTSTFKRSFGLRPLDYRRRWRNKLLR